MCARSCSPRKYASSRRFGFVARARIIFDAARVSSRLENTRPSLPFRIFLPQLAGNNSTQRGTRDRMPSPWRRKRNLSPPNLLLPYFPPAFLFDHGWFHAVLNIEVSNLGSCVGRRYGGRIDFRLFGKRYAEYRRETFLGELCIGVIGSAC